MHTAVRFGANFEMDNPAALHSLIAADPQGEEVTEDKVYEVRLSGSGRSSVQFVTIRTSDELAEMHARALLARFTEYHRAEIWCGMKLIREIVLGIHGPGQA